jgi:hypothetical protein
MDKPQNLLEPPISNISNYEDKLVRVDTKDSNTNLESQNKFQECTNMLSTITCGTEGDDKPVLNPTTDDKPVLNPTANDKPVLNSDNGDENTQNEKNQNKKNAYDFLSSVTK